MSKTQLVRFEANDVLFKEGDTTRDLYIVRSGTVQVSKISDNGVIPIAVLGEGSFVGEMSFISGLPRSATVVAREDVSASLVSSEVLKSDPFGINDWAVNIARVIADRVRRTTNLIGEYRNAAAVAGHESSGETINEFGLRDEVAEQRVVVYLKGYFYGKHLNELKKVLRTYAARGFTQAVIDFAGVPDIDKAVLDFLVQITGDSNTYNLELSIRNVQLVRSKILSIKGIERIVARSQLPQVRVTQYEYLIRQNEVGNVMYVVKTGRLSITREVDGEEILLGHAEAGDVIGELNLLKEGTRSANVRAERTCVVYKLSVDDFNRNLYKLPNWFMEIVRSLVVRLRQTNDMLEREVRRQSTEDEPVAENVPICILMDSARPGHIVIRENLVEGNLEYVTTMVNLLLKRGSQRIFIDLREVETIDQTAIRYLLKLHVYLQKRGGLLQLSGKKAKIVKLFGQYGVELPRPTRRSSSSTGGRR